jgi:hypothetical protein
LCTRVPGRASQNIGLCGQGSGRIAFREADHRAGITYLTGAGPLVLKRREAGTGFAGQPEAGLRGEQPAVYLAGQRLRSLELRCQVFGRAELLERLMAAAAAGVQHPGRLVQQQPDVRPGVCLQGPFGAPQPPLALVELTQPHHRAGERGLRLKEARRADDRHTAGQVLRLTISDVADHVERFSAIYRNALNDPIGGGVYEALVRCFIDRSSSVIARSAPRGLPQASHQVMAKFFAHGFAGAVKGWLSDDSVTRADLIEASVACAPPWWN